MHPSLLQLEPIGSPAPLVGIAKLAAQGESIRHGHDVEYFTLRAKALLNRCVSKRVPFNWTINPYRGCEFACKYCYARYTHEFMEMRDGLYFERKIYVKQQTAWLLLNVDLALEIEAIAHFHELVGVARIAVFAGELAAAVGIDGPVEWDTLADTAIEQSFCSKGEVFDIVAMANGFAL